ncbi:phosphatidylinositol-glycan biosynthesis class X protein-like [Cimex lectularius]|uniref:Phosphatidylinositol-glycan biosynthesis class X protein n=1 Tax=Cimex lectularius TaxID=79782 RepID=A0A8I6RPK5_CIMLE|nr:phosphatidylinositol-glycan biosynthesis class X protein-like [Cimex lectularius]
MLNPKLNICVLASFFFFGTSSEIEECNFVLTVSRNINKLGFHRDLSYSFELITNGVWEECRLCIEEQIPKGLFVNINQIEDLERFGKISALVNATDNIEKPEDESEPQNVKLYTNLTRTFNILTSSVNLPFHFRYHEAQPNGGFKKAVIGPPSVFMTCLLSPTFCRSNNFVELPCSSEVQQTCSFQPMNYHINLEYLEIDIPVGDTNHYNLVLFFTLFVTSSGAIYVLTVIVNNKRFD